MKKIIRTIAIRTLAIGFGVGMLYSCSMDPDSPGLEYMPDMYRSPAIEPYMDYGWIKEKTHKDLTTQLSAMRPPLKTIPYHGNVGEENLIFYMPYQRAASKFAPKTHGLEASEGWKIGTTALGDYYKAAADKNPITLTSENTEKIKELGERLYDINCVHCHGEEGDGKGPMVESGAYVGVPNYHNLKDLADGQMFYSIFYGKGMMGAHANLLTKKDIWTLVHYVNHFRFDNYWENPTAHMNKVESADSTNVQ